MLNSLYDIIVYSVLVTGCYNFTPNIIYENPSVLNPYEITQKRHPPFSLKLKEKVSNIRTHYVHFAAAVRILNMTLRMLSSDKKYFCLSSFIE